ncbi:MAG: hypothetical protein QF577_03540 [Phycisphaerae bacterium]|nr:hypothetical protein [Phycisphaerae bacterium]
MNTEPLPTAHCYIVTHECNSPASVKKWGGFMPSMVRQDVAGYSPMNGGDHKWAAPWIWGKTFRAAEEAAESYNLNVLGLSQDDVDNIVISSMTAGRG